MHGNRFAFISSHTYIIGFTSHEKTLRIHHVSQIIGFGVQIWTKMHIVLRLSSSCNNGFEGEVWDKYTGYPLIYISGLVLLNQNDYSALFKHNFVSRSTNVLQETRPLWITSSKTNTFLCNSSIIHHLRLYQLWVIVWLQISLLAYHPHSPNSYCGLYSRDFRSYIPKQPASLSLGVLNRLMCISALWIFPFFAIYRFP